ncbi:hypothetical protein EYF80_016751 [Liparis tanakae]|uniref:Uncharacterized protein n=1 Tax=Liparis tanakae TaxID=230148 RepID=A0A4Z2I5N2_9TELE|nr:hypothetical protein EYF80_016751 [Liparis tanakae]
MYTSFGCEIGFCSNPEPSWSDRKKMSSAKADPCDGVALTAPSSGTITKTCTFNIHLICSSGGLWVLEAGGVVQIIPGVVGPRVVVRVDASLLLEGSGGGGGGGTTVFPFMGLGG